ncbi:unnamed protein product [Dicrocoelium dendriticum]|nr:unnamed protein product [Dicrocoelium dendriticum]
MPTERAARSWHLATAIIQETRRTCHIEDPRQHLTNTIERIGRARQQNADNTEGLPKPPQGGGGGAGGGGGGGGATSGGGGGGGGGGGRQE